MVFVDRWYELPLLPEGFRMDPSVWYHRTGLKRGIFMMPILCGPGNNFLLKVDPQQLNNLGFFQHVPITVLKFDHQVFRQCRVSAAFGGDKGHGLFCDHAGRPGAWGRWLIDLEFISSSIPSKHTRKKGFYSQKRKMSASCQCIGRNLMKFNFQELYST